jgi:phosphoserine phosphatase
MRFAFDVDNTLIRNDKETVIAEIARSLSATHDVIVWSGGGREYAQLWMDRLGIKGTAASKTFADSINADVAFDDQDVRLAKVNIKVF